MRKTSLFKRSLAGLLTLVLVLGMIPAMSWVARAAEGDDSETTTTTANVPEGNFITLPITVRDFAADGMLFEFNEMGESTFTALDDGYAEYDPDDLAISWGTTTSFTISDRVYTSSTTTGYEYVNYTATYNPSSSNATFTSDTPTGIYVMPADYTMDFSGYLYWYCLIIDDNGNVLKVLPSGTAKTTFASDIVASYTLSDGSTATPAYSVWAWRSPANLLNYSLLAKVTEENKEQFSVGFYEYTYGTAAGETLYENDDLYFYLGNKYNAYTGDFVHDSLKVGQGDEITLSDYGHWYRIICDSSNQVVAVLPVDADASAYTQYQTSSYKIVMASGWRDGMPEILSHITAENMSEYQIVTPTCSRGRALFIERTITANAANTKGFGLLYTTEDDHRHWLGDNYDGYADNEGENLPNTEYLEYSYTYGTEDDFTFPYKADLWEVTPEGNVVNYATQDLYGAGIRTNLVSMGLDDEGKPVYTKTTVDFLANYMAMVMPIEEKTNGAYNTNRVMGVKMFTGNPQDGYQYVGPNAATAEYDLAEVLRAKIWAKNGYSETEGWKLGDYTTSKNKFENDGLRTYNDVETWYDAAYFLLHNTWRDSTGDDGSDGYGMPTSYHSMHLVETTNAQGQTTYVFNAKYDGTTYDPNGGVIYNSAFADTEDTTTRTYSAAYTRAGVEDSIYGNVMPAQRFDPLGPSGAGQNLGYGMSGATYGEFGNLDRLEYYDETNYNLSLEGHAQFVYQYDADQYFTFTGDDDVYLYINGFRVLDIGGAHSISQVTIRLNDVAKNIGLENGKTYSFDFFYMERHGTAANFGIETNIQIADPSMNTTKQGFQNGVNTGYGGPVNADNHVGYTFELENNGTAHLYDLTFNDPALGVYFGYDEIRPYPEGETGGEGTSYPYTIEDDLYLIYYNSAGDIVEYLKPGEVTADILQEHLKDGLEPGEKLGIYGIKYKIKEAQWSEVDGAEEFINTVYTTATANGKTLNGVADWKVVKMEHPYEAFRVYDWVHKTVSNDPADAENLIWKTPKENGINVDNGVTVTKNELITKYLLNGENNDLMSLTEAEKAAIEITQCTAAGNEDPYFFRDSKAKVNEDGSITYTSDTVGKDTVFFKFKNVTLNGEKKAVYDSLVFSYEVYTYGAVDNIYVLDYGLSVELAGETFGFQNNDHLQLNENNRTMEVEVLDMVDANGNSIVEKVGTYGTFTWDADNKSLKYTPDEIIDDIDYVYAKFRIMEKGTDIQFSKFTGVDMVQKITTAPASVMYYEEDFPGITYCDNDNDNEWVHYETLGTDGKPVAGTEQSADQETNYGSDPNYEDNKGGVGETDGTEITFTVDTDDANEAQAQLVNKLAKYLGLTGEDSNGTYNKLVVNATEEVMSFVFKGTGFEIVSRTTQDQYALIQVKVILWDEQEDKAVINQRDADGNLPYPQLPATDKDGVCRTKIVITESKGGDLYQVPIIAIKDLDRHRYKVSVTASYHQKQERVLYIDGIRIYGPLSDDVALEYYNPREVGADYYEVKNLIASFNAIFAELKKYDNNKLTLGAGFTLIENVGTDDIVLTNKNKDGDEVTLTDYLSVGPNNEIYLDGNTTTSLIAFFLDPDENVPQDQRTIQIGAHRKANSANDGVGDVGMYYGSTIEALTRTDVEITEQPYYYNVKSGTEQYFDIKVDHLVQGTDGRYLVLIVAAESDKDEALALTNLKLKGYEVEFLEPDFRAASVDGTLGQNRMIQTVAAVLGIGVSEDEDENGSGAEEDTELSNVNQDMLITTAGLKSDSVATGKKATLAVSATLNAEEIEVLDAEGNPVTSTSLTRKATDDEAVFTFIFRVYGNSGDKQVYTIRVKDADGKYSANTMTVTGTIR